MRRLLSPLGSRRLLRSLCAAGMLLAGWASGAGAAEPGKSLLPVFGTKGYFLQGKAMSGHDIRGWLPMDWIDNSSWAPVSAVYTQLDDAPEPNIGALRVEVTKRFSHHLQLTIKGGARPFQQGATYTLAGWIRGPEDADVFAGFREDDEPRKYFAGQNLSATAEWKRFSVEWTPETDLKAWVMITFHKVGTVDLAGLTLEEKK